MVAPVTPARVVRKTGLKNILACPAWIFCTGIPICPIISIPYLKENTIPSWAARMICCLPCALKSRPRMLQPISLLHSIRSAPLPKGSILSPALPMGAVAANTFISLYEIPSGATLRFTHELRIPVPLIQSNTPRRIWLTL